MVTKAKEKVTAKEASSEKAAKKVVVSKATKAVTAKKGETKKVADVTGKVKVTQMIGSIGRRSDQEATLIGLGLNKRHKSRVLEDTPSVRGMIYKVRHLLKVESVN